MAGRMTAKTSPPPVKKTTGNPRAGIAGPGRPKGVPNKVTLEREKAIAASGLTPLDYMLGVLRDEGQSLDARMDAAKNAAPYVHPKLATVAHTGADGGAIRTTNEIILRGVVPK